MDKKIQYQFSAGTEGFDRAVDSIERSMREARQTFNRELRSINADLQGTQNNIEQMGGATGGAFALLGGQLRGSLMRIGGMVAAAFSVIQLKDFVADSKQALIEYQGSMQGLEAVASHAGVGVGEAMRRAAELSADGLISVGDAAKSLQNLLSRGYSVDQAVAVIERLKDAAAFNRQANLSMSEAVVSATEGLKNENSVLVDNAGITKNVSKMWEEYARSIGTTRDKLSDSQKVAAEVLGVMKATAAQAGNADRASNGLSGSQDRLSQSMVNLKVTVGTSLEPAFISLNETLSATVDWFTQVIRGVAGIPRAIDEVEGDIARLEAQLKRMGGGSGIAAAGVSSRLSGLQRELDAARLASKDISQIDTLIADLGRRITAAESKVVAAATPKLKGGVAQAAAAGGRAAYAQDMKALDALKLKLQEAVALRDGLSSRVTAPAGGSDGGGGTGGGSGAAKSRMSQWTEAIEAQKLAHAMQQQEAGTYYQFSVEQEAAYWQKILQRTDLSATERQGVQRSYLTAVTALRRQAEGQEFADLEARAQQFRFNMDARLEIARESLARSGQLYGHDSDEYRRAAAEVVAIEREKHQQLRDMQQQDLDAVQRARLADVAHAQEMAQLDLQAGLVTQQELLRQQAEFERRRYAIEREALVMRQALLAADPDRNPVALQALHQQIEALEQGHRQRLQLLGQQQLIESQTNWTGMMQTLRGSWESGMNSILMGTMSTQGLLRGIFQSIYAAFVQNMVTKPLMDWIFAEGAKTAATVTGVGLRTAAETAGASASVMIWAGAAIKNILSSAWQAMAGAFAAMTAIPIVGPILGAAAAVAAGAFVFGLVKNVASAEGGYDIPAGTNPLTQLHEQEMVLPKQYANVIRRAADGDGGLGGGAVVHYNDHSGRLTASEIRRNARVIATELSRLRRNNGVDPS